MKTRKMLVMAASLWFLGFIFVSTARAEYQLPKLLHDIIGEIQEKYGESNCDPAKFEQKFDELTRKYQGNQNFVQEKIPNLPGKYDLNDSNDWIQVHDITKGMNFPASFPEKLSYALHFNRDLKIASSQQFESEMHTIFRIKDQDGGKAFCAFFWDEPRGISDEECFDLSRCDSMDGMRSWVEEKSKAYVPTLSGDAFSLDPNQLWEIKIRLIENGVSFSAACQFATLLKEKGPEAIMRMGPPAVIAGALVAVIPAMIILAPVGL